MGDRASIELVYPREGSKGERSIWLYTHWGATDLPTTVTDLLDRPQYEESGGFPVERGYIWTTCSSVQNGNPLFWDDEVADALTGGPIAVPTLLSAWFRPHHWSPVRGEGLALQVHFDLKERLDLPEAIMSDNTIIFHEPVRPGDLLRTRQILQSVSGPKTTKLGSGRFWVIDVEYLNQRDELVGVESYTGFGYKRPAEADDATDDGGAS
jgi:acyl dehydratase